MPPRIRRRAPAALPALLVALSQLPAVAAADDLSFVSDDELAGEIDARRADLDRTRSRLAALEADLEAARGELEGARLEVADIESRLIARVALLYRLSHRGAAMRLLLEPGAGTASLRRIGTLERLVREGLERRREAGLRLAGIEGRIEETSARLSAARELASGLEDACAELEAERARREPR
jgi:chromosome segregation ATPase